MTYYISNKDAAEEMQKAFNQYVRLLKTDIKRETTTADEHLNNESCTAEPTVEKWDIDLSKIERPDPLLEDVIKYVVSEQVGSIAEIQRKFEIGPNRTIKICEQLEALGILGPNRGVQGYEVLIKNMKELQQSSTAATTTQNTKPTRIRTKSNLRELDALVGLTSVKEEIRTLSNFIQIQQKRKEQGLKASSVSYHCVFTGNPGTGKTTVARIVAKIYKKLGILSKGHLVETDRAGLVAEYVGQTAVKTNKIIDSALDGVLFIDEAYSLIGTGQDYGKEAIATLLKRMEDDRDRLVVILAGYSKEMQDFINTNPGLQSRFNRYIEFPDYSAEELLQIFEMNVQKFDYKLEKEAAVAMAEYFQNAVNNKDANFGNARFVRNIFEKTLEKQANRLSTDPDLDKDELTLITKEDLPILECK
jgi:SpoVK/Ycf46/Vps4 family AAA+-type ATPase